jgi:hypothetical protein
VTLKSIVNDSLQIKNLIYSFSANKSEKSNTKIGCLEPSLDENKRHLQTH